MKEQVKQGKWWESSGIEQVGEMVGKLRDRKSRGNGRKEKGFMQKKFEGTHNVMGRNGERKQNGMEG